MDKQPDLFVEAAAAMRRCSLCKELKPATREHFSSCKKSPDGLQARCKRCAAAEQARKRKEDPERFRAASRRYFDENRKTLRRKLRERYWKNHEQNLENMRLYREAKKDTINATGRKTQQSLRRRVVEAYGGKCECCGETEYRFLTLHHTAKDGKAHRERVGSQRDVYKDLERRGWPQEGYQILCWNCHMAKDFYGGCPHKRQAKE